MKIDDDTDVEGFTPAATFTLSASSSRTISCGRSTPATTSRRAAASISARAAPAPPPLLTIAEARVDAS